MSLFKLIRFVWQHPLNSGGRLRALSRVLRWQIATRLLPEAQFALPFVNDASLLVQRGMTGATGNWYCGLDEADDMAFVSRILRPGDLFVDIGANIGSYSILAVACAQADVIAVEPVRETFRHLSRNIALNGFQELIAAHRLGISDESGTLRFTSLQDSINHVTIDTESAEIAESESEEVAVVTLDQLLRQHAGGRVPRVIKIDVEGYEMPVLKGATLTLSAPELFAVVMETNGLGQRYGWKDSELEELMASYGFEPNAYDVVKGTLRPRKLGTAGNTIYLRQNDVVESITRAAPRSHLVTGWI